MDRVLAHAPISQLKKEQEVFLTKLDAGPVLVMQRSQPVAVMIRPDDWNDIAQQVADLQTQLERERRLRLSNRRYAAWLDDPARGIDQDTYDQSLAAAEMDT